MCGIHPSKCVSADDILKDKVMLPIGGKVYRIDMCIHHIVAALNAGGIATSGCCCGHGINEPSILLADGREIVIRSYNINDKDQQNATT